MDKPPPLRIDRLLIRSDFTLSATGRTRRIAVLRGGSTVEIGPRLFERACRGLIGRAAATERAMWAATGGAL